MSKKSQSKKSSTSHKSRLHYFRNHPLAIPAGTFAVLLFISVAAFLLFGGQTIDASDSRVVLLRVDGQEQVVPTRARTVGELLERRDISVEEKDIIEPALDTEITVHDFEVDVYKAKPILVVDDDKKTIVVSAETTPQAVAEDAGLTVYPEDRIQRIATDLTNPTEAIQEGLIAERIVIERATPVKFNLYGTVIDIRTHVKTVEELLKEKGVQLREDDTLRPSADTELTPNLQVFVLQTGIEIDVVEEPIEMPVEVIQDPNLAAGTVRVQERGSEGLKAVTYEIELENDQEVSRKILQESVLREPVQQVEVHGTKVIISNPSENVKLGERMAAERGWTGSEWYCLYQLWQKESGWNHLVGNPSSGAYGIPQSLPASKMAVNGADYRTNPATQIAWGLDYITRTYGAPCSAWNTFNSRYPSWY
ncbi:MAG: ubiquitin-like domain-containing protein [Candidatus Saccharibacteria bacterium]|nr:ubiquitin-like domain-containing protein [Candidatus Saccharibacteria bacterium]